MAPSDSFDLKSMDLDTKIVILSTLVQMLWFYEMVANIMHLCTSHVKTAIFHNFCKDPYPSYHMLKCGSVLLSGNRDMVKDVILQKS